MRAKLDTFNERNVPNETLIEFENNHVPTLTDAISCLHPPCRKYKFQEIQGNQSSQVIEEKSSILGPHLESFEEYSLRQSQIHFEARCNIEAIVDEKMLAEASSQQV